MDKPREHYFQIENGWFKEVSSSWKGDSKTTVLIEKSAADKLAYAIEQVVPCKSTMRRHMMMDNSFELLKRALKEYRGEK